MTCPTLTVGSVSSTGSVNGWNTAGLRDAYFDRTGVEGTPGVNSQWQAPMWLTDNGAAATPAKLAGQHYVDGDRVKSEHVISLGLVAGRTDSNPVPFPSLNVAQPVGLTWFEADGSFYQWVVVFGTRSANNCNMSQKNGDGGSITLTYADDTRVEGTYSGLTFQGATGSASGSFVAPRAGVSVSLGVSGCPAKGSGGCVDG